MTKGTRATMLNYDKRAVLLAIVEAYDRIGELESELREARHDVEALLSGDEPDEGLCEIDLAMLRVGRVATLEKHTRSWVGVTATRDEETGRVVTASFERFCGDYIGSVPDFMSLDEFKQYFYDELMEAYEDRKGKAIRRLEVEEDA